MTLLRRAKRVYEAEGSRPLARRGLAFLRYCLFYYQSYYLYADPIDHLRDLSEADFLPKVDGFTVKVVSSNEEADELEASGLPFRSQIAGAGERLDREAVALLIFVEKELVYVNWAALTEQAQRAIGEPPYRLDLASREACSGGLWTHPCYRRRGLRRYGRFLLLRFLQQRGIRTKRTAIAKRNVIAQQGRHEYPLGPQGEGRYLRVLWWKSWKEKPLS